MGYFAHDIKTPDIVLNEREGNFEENGLILANFGVMFFKNFWIADGNISWGASRGSLDPI